MAKVISFISRKGGTGKTTNAINIANVLSEMGNNVVVIETDVNYTLSTLRQRERRKLPEGKRIPSLVRTEETSMIKMIKTFQNDGVTDYIVVDTAGGNTTSYCTNRLCVMSDLVIVPTSLSINDTLVTEHTINDILPAKKENPDLMVFLLPNRVHSMTSDDTIKHTLSHLKVPILDVFVANKKVYTHPSTVKAAEGYNEVVSVILKHLNGTEPLSVPEPAVEHEIFNEDGVAVNETMNPHEEPSGESERPESVTENMIHRYNT